MGYEGMRARARLIRRSSGGVWPRPRRLKGGDRVHPAVPGRTAALFRSSSPVMSGILEPMGLLNFGGASSLEDLPP
jgi:hypothetical protein